MATPETIAKRLARAAEAAGAQDWDIIAVASATTGIGVRGGELEDIEASGGLDVGLRVLMGPAGAQRQAAVSGSDVSDAALEALATRAVAMAREAPVDPYAGLAEPGQLANPSPPALDLLDTTPIDPDALKARALAVEAAALSVAGVAQAEGASASATRSDFVLLTSTGFTGGWASSRHTIGVSAIASDGTSMERDYDHHGRRFLEDLPEPEEVGLTAGRRAVGRLGARQIDSRAMPVIFDRRVADNLLGAFLSAVTGTSVARGSSFLKARMGERIFPAGFTIHDDPHLPRGLGSRPTDAEGLACAPLTLVEDGVLSHWLLNLATARQLGLASTARAQRSVGSAPGVSPTNAWIAPSAVSPEALRADITEGLHVAEMFGPSLNINTGDYSVGVAGFAIRGGELAHPVSEVTVAGNLLEMFGGLRAADDLVFDGAVTSPSLRVESLAVAGQ